SNIEYLENKEQPLPEYMISILKQLAGGITYKTVLMQDMARYAAFKTKAANDLIRSELNDNAIDWEYLRNWYDNLNSINADYEIVYTYLAEKDYSSAQALLDMIPVLRELNGNDLMEFEAYKYLNLKQIQLEQQGLNITRLNDTTVNLIAEIAQTGSGPAVTQAQSILEYAWGYHFGRCLAEVNETLFKKGSLSSAKSENGLTIIATPNPANNWVAFNYTLPMNSSEGILKVTDMNGRFIVQFSVSNSQGQKIWDTREVNKGLYIY
ncbi:MAG TPA: hypothetical protein DCL86_18785, partial [Bacteroidales bacterium]|nr:hypothetical protein [Bacteroidales bacterium]